MTGCSHTAARKRVRTTLAVAPVTRAIRTALAASATMLVLSAPVTAGTCNYAEVPRNSYVCDASILVSQDAAPLSPIDLTQVQGEEAPVSVVPAWGAGWVGDISRPHQNSLDDGDASSPAILDAGTVDDITVIGDTGGIVATAFSDVSVIVNSGDVTVYGEVSSSYDVAYLTNGAGNVIDVTAGTLDGDALGVGAMASGWDAATLTNYGAISARATSANGDAQAYAAIADGTYAGIGLLINGGDLSAEASVGTGGRAIATGAFAYGNVATVFNDANSSAIASAGEGGTALASGARAYGEYTAVSNYGALTASASADGGTAMAKGADSLGYLGSSVYNAGDIQANASADGGAATAIGVYSLGVIFGGYTTNTGTINAHASGDGADALGVLNAAVYLGNAITINDGSISAVAEGAVAPYGEEEAVAIGAYNFAMYYDSVVDNRGSISAVAVATADISGTNGFLQAKAIGVQALATHGYGETTIVNTGDIHASAVTSQGYASTWGAVAQAGAYGSAAIENDGVITSYAHSDIGVGVAVGAYVLSVAGTSQVVNHGDIVATADAERGIVDVSVNYADAIGVQVFSIPYGDGQAIVDNYGNIRANAVVLGGIGYATGVNAYGRDTTVHNSVGGSITAAVEAELFGGAFATAIEAGSQYDFNLVNDGRVTAYAHANAYGTHYGAAGANGIYVNASYKGDAVVTNNGDIDAIAIADNSISWAQGGAGTTGVHVYAKYDASIINAGDINAFSQAQFGNVAAYGAVVHGKYAGQIINQAGASIVASASAGSLAGDQYAGRAVSFGTQIFGSGMEAAYTYNAGSIVSHAFVAPDGTDAAIGSLATAFGSSIGYNSGIMQAEVVNVGSIEADASADFGYATAYGAVVITHYDSTITNAGEIHALASAKEGNAFAVGTYAFSLHQNVTYNCDSYGCDYSNPIIDVDGGNSLIENNGDIVAAANAQGGVGYSYGAVTLGAFAAHITNSGSIVAHTEADDALAVGGLANSFMGNAEVVNSGTIVAIATGASASAIGVDVIGQYGDLKVDNVGRITAAAYGSDASAVAVFMDSSGTNSLMNTGTIASLGDGERLAISSSTEASATIINSGSIIGAIVTGDRDDSFTNAAGGLWQAVGESDFGTGSNQIVNHGVIVMDDAMIGLGSESAGYANVAALAIGNVFDNAGTVVVLGDTNRVAMAGATMTNNGVVSFIDGSADDALTIAGNFAGRGAINLDISGLNEVSDRLHVEGSVIDGTAQVLNINMLDMPGTAQSRLTLLSTGTSLAGDFTLGGVQYAADGFLAMNFALVQSASEVALEMDVTGLNATGSLAAAIAPGVQSLVNAQVGTWRQRMGVVPQSGPVGVAPWVRMFSDSGDVTPSHSANFGAEGTFGFHQSNRGWELGLNTQPTAQLSVGALIASSNGRQSMAGAGSDHFDGQSFGVYATWQASSGFYLDVSHRWTGIEARLRSAVGTYETEASAQTWNVEAGVRAWSSAGGLNVMPQAQYSHTRVTDLETLSNGQADFVNAEGVSSRVRLGVALEQSFQGGGFTWTPYGSVNALREFDGAYEHAINGGLHGTSSTEGTSAMIELGLGARRNALSVTGGVNWTDGGALDSLTGAQVALRYDW